MLLTTTRHQPKILLRMNCIIERKSPIFGKTINFKESGRASGSETLCIIEIQNVKMS